MIADPPAVNRADSPSGTADPCGLRLETALDLLLCGVLIAGLPLLSRHCELEVRRATAVLGLAGGGLCFLWTVLGRLGWPVLWGAILTLAAAASVFLWQTVESWQAAVALGAKGRMAGAVMAALSIFCVGTLVNLAREAMDHR